MVQEMARGAPGIAARWTSSAKSGVGTALSPAAQLWFTIGYGIINEVYYPRVDSACTRDLGLLVTGPDGYFSEEKRHTNHIVKTFEDGVSAFILTNIATDETYRIDKRIVADPVRPTLLQEIKFTALKGIVEDYQIYALLAPHLVNHGMGNSAWIGDYKGEPMLFATGSGGVSLALACSLPWGATTAGYVGFSDGWTELSQGGELDLQSRRAENGNVALTGQIGFSTQHPRALIALGFGPNPNEAAYNARASLMDGFDSVSKNYGAGWRAWQKGLEPLDRFSPQKINKYRVSTAVLAAHKPMSFSGAAVASLSVPWGSSMGDDNLGGYHLVWPRDLVETAGGFLAAGSPKDALEILGYLRTIQEKDGHWPQNCWLDGSAYWGGLQMDECAFPLILVEMLHRKADLTGPALLSFLPMIEKAAGFITKNGPVTGEDRWEEDAGYSPFTLAVEIAGLLAAADMLEVCGKLEAAQYLRETADTWNDQIERWTYVSGTVACEQYGVEGYYVRIAPPDTSDAASPSQGFVAIKNRPPTKTDQPTAHIVSPDALALVRFGIRAADDPRIVNTIKLIDAQLKAELPQGSLWYRYSGDGYGEHADGAPFDGTGIGRPWPLLAGERAHYEIAAGRSAIAEGLLETFEASAGEGGMLPEQTWDGPDLVEHGLAYGRPSGSAMPLVWAHSEHIKLIRSLRDGAVFDMPPQGSKRYLKDGKTSAFRTWRFNNKIKSMPTGKMLRIELLASAMVHWSSDHWQTVHDSYTSENLFGAHIVDLPTSELGTGSRVIFTYFWPDQDRWETVDFTVEIQ